MSADNWRIYPKCYQKALQKRHEIDREVRDSYGKVSEDEYLALMERARQPVAPSGDTLREDYQIFMMEDGVFKVEYRCSCDVCGFSFDYEDAKKVKL